MKTIAIVVRGGAVEGIYKITDAPEEGFLIIDYDNVYGGNSGREPEEELEEQLNSFFEVDGVFSYEDFVQTCKEE